MISLNHETESIFLHNYGAKLSLIYFKLKCIGGSYQCKTIPESGIIIFIIIYYNFNYIYNLVTCKNRGIDVNF